MPALAMSDQADPGSVKGFKGINILCSLLSNWALLEGSDSH